jgi:hypothetical protein
MIRPVKLNSKRILKIGSPLAVIAFILFILVSARPVPIRVQITFIGFTNTDITYTTTNGTFPVTLAYFSVSNIGKCSVFEDGFHACEIRNKPLFEDFPRFVPSYYELKPGEFQTMSLTTPPDNIEPWRVSLLYYKIDWRYRLQQKQSWVFRKIRGFVPDTWFMQRQGTEVDSDWINGPELAQVEPNAVKNPPSLP